MIGSHHFPPFVLPLVGMAVALIAVALLSALFFAPRPRSHGSARWAKPGEVKSLLAPVGPVLGRDEKGRVPRYGGDAPLLCAAPSRSGKGVGLIIPTLLDMRRSCIVVDPKGEAARATSLRRAEFGTVWVVDPFAAAGGMDSFNPLAVLAADSPTFVEDAMTLADAICAPDAPGGGDGAGEHFNSTARTLLRAFIMHCTATEPLAHQHLGTVRSYAGLGEDAFRALLEEMAASSVGGGVVARIAHQQLARDPREAAAVMSTVARQTEWLDSASVTRSLGTNDFRFEELKERVGTVFIVIPPDRLGAFSRWLRLMVTSVVVAFAQSPLPGSAGATLLIVDECAALGRLPAIETVMTVMSGYGLQGWLFFQDLAQAHAIYRERADSLISNAGVFQIFDVSDNTTAETVSKMLGNQTILVPTGGGPSGGTTRSARPLMAPDEVRRQRGRSIVFTRGARPVHAQKIRWFADKQFRALGHDERGLIS
ncbi:MAG TPA: type IV secretory system conjugative DNA transfer family protein [Hyphomicrobium zavarzinii]|nr:type IV secretory system conjugative DNA transfer family protein [Hyphomicrobium zavarzinii]